MPAAPMPPPMHIVTMPYLLLRRLSHAAVVPSTAPVQQRVTEGNPPPMTLTFSAFISR
ncbi:MAG: hypothetical protein U0694_04775 [Anaerolineae bacterium]